MIYARAIPYLLASAAAIAALFGAYLHGCSVTDEKWQSRWNSEALKQIEQQRDADQSARREEQRRQKVADDASQDAKNQIESAKADAADANAVAVRMLKQADRLARFAGDSSCAASASSNGTATAGPAMVLADVLGRVDGVAGELAAAYDAARIAGLACERVAGGVR